MMRTGLFGQSWAWAAPATSAAASIPTPVALTIPENSALNIETPPLFLPPASDAPPTAPLYL
jgi:hypothetical protein